MEHQIVRNLLMTQYWRVENASVSWKSIVESTDKKKKEYVKISHAKSE